MNKKLFILFVSIFLSVNFVFAQDVTKYQNISKGLDNASTTEISNTSTLGLVGVARYIGMMAAAAIVTLVIFKLIEGAVLKGTYDNIYDQQKGNKIIQNAVISLLIFIFVNLLFTYINPDYGSWIFGASTSVDTSSSANITNISGKCVNDPKYISASFLDQIKQDEEDGKFAEKPYMDSLGYPTIGWGFNIDASNEPKKYLTQVGIKDAQLTNLISCKKGAEGSKTLIGNCGSEKITKAQADQLLEIELKAHMPAVYKFAGGEAAFNKLPKNIQNVIMNLSYAGDALLTPGNKKYFKKLNDAINTTPLNYDNIANEIINSTWCTQTKSRCGRIVGLIYNGKCPTNSYTGIGSSLASQQMNTNSKVNISKVYPTYSPANCKIVLKRDTLIDIGGEKGSICGGSYLKPDAAQKFKEMQEAAKKDGITITPTCGYRDDDQQLAAWKSNGCKTTQDSCRIPTAIPCSLPNGTGSNHSTGYAVDIKLTKCSATDKTCNDPVFLWMKKNGYNYGFDNTFTNRMDNIHWSPSGR